MKFYPYEKEGGRKKVLAMKGGGGVITDVFGRGFPICDVPGGQFGKPPILTEGNCI